MHLSPAADTCLLYLVRHGATDSNLSQPPVLQGNGINGPLAEIGRRQAAQAARFFDQVPLDALYSSPMRRALESAEIINRSHQLPIQTVSELVEVGVGSWEGRDWGEIMASEPEAYAQHMEDPSLHGYPGGENVCQVAERVVPAIETILRENLGKVILVTAHNIVNRVVIAHLNRIPLSQIRHIRQDNCGINLLRHHKGKTEVITVNSVFHLRDDA
ncbi:MAG: histidine phosphatase family protein [Pirellulaceae bacterium]